MKSPVKTINVENITRSVKEPFDPPEILYAPAPVSGSRMTYPLPVHPLSVISA